MHICAFMLRVLNFVYCKFAQAVVVGECLCVCVKCARSTQQMQVHSGLENCWNIFEMNSIEKEERNKRNLLIKINEILLFYFFQTLFYEHRQQHPKLTNDTVTNNKLFFFSFWLALFECDTVIFCIIRFCHCQPTTTITTENKVILF